jgi:hypothetical protein
LRAIFVRNRSRVPRWTLLLIRAFGRHGGAEGEELQHQEGGASCPWLLYDGRML